MRLSAGASSGQGVSGPKAPVPRAPGGMICLPTSSAVSRSSMSGICWPVASAMSQLWVLTSKIPMFTATAAGTSPNGSFTVFSRTPGCRKAARKRRAASSKAPL